MGPDQEVLPIVGGINRIMELGQRNVQMADTRINCSSSVPIHSSCLEAKMARIIPESNGPKAFISGKGGLIKGDFDVEALIEELTIEEKASLLAGE